MKSAVGELAAAAFVAFFAGYVVGWLRAHAVVSGHRRAGDGPKPLDGVS